MKKFLKLINYYNQNKGVYEMNQLEQTNDNRSMMKTSYGDQKLDKSNELNDSMTINESSRDEYESTLHNIGGVNNG